MDVVWHGYKCRNIHMGETLAQFEPLLMGDLSKRIQLHFFIHYRTEQAVHLPGADGDEIGVGSGVIVAWQADGAAMIRWPEFDYKARWGRGAADGNGNKIMKWFRYARMGGGRGAAGEFGCGILEWFRCARTMVAWICD